MTQIGQQKAQQQNKSPGHHISPDDLSRCIAGYFTRSINNRTVKKLLKFFACKRPQSISRKNVGIRQEFYAKMCSMIDNLEALGKEALEDLRSPLDFIRWGTRLFNQQNIFLGHGTDDIQDEALYIVAHCIGMSPEQVNTFKDVNLLTSERQQLVALLIKRVTERIPAAYLTKQAWFAGLNFYVDQRVLIPRSPFAELIESEFRPWIDPEGVQDILDMCTGSACIAIASACYFPDAKVDAADISPHALEVARINVDKHELGHRVTLYESDLFKQIPKKQYDLIISNPPYVATQELNSLPPEYAHEPNLGLEAGFSGLRFALNILYAASDYLRDGGSLFVEVGASQQRLMEVLPQVPFTWVDLERGGEGIFFMPKEQLLNYKEQFKIALDTI